ncbi:MAG: carboxypeptidase regulatory-like domain-containing protein [Terriglobia bacterium]
MIRSLWRGAVGVCVILAFWGSYGVAQTTFGSITGTVTDPSGAVVPNAKVTVTNQGTGVARHVTTGATGAFNVANLDVGTYQVAVTASGFQTFQQGNLILSANQVLNVPVQLALGATAQVARVVARTPVINTQNAMLSNVTTNKDLEQLPLSVARHYGDQGFYAFTLLNTGVSAINTSSTPIVSGARQNSGVLPTIDGIAVMAYPIGPGPVQPSLDADQEVNVITADAPAEFATVGSFSVVTKSGTNQFHGGLYYDYNSSDFNARNFFSSTVPSRVYNNFSADLGGPIIKDKLFFYGDYEGSREAAQNLLVTNVPLPAWRSGDFSDLLSQGVTISNPFTKQNFANNMIPSNLINPVSNAIQTSLFPQPNTGGPGAQANNYTGLFPGTTGFTRFDNIDARVDFDPTTRDALFARISYRKLPLSYLNMLPTLANEYQERWGETAVASWTHTFSPTLVNEFRGGGTYQRNLYYPQTVGSNLIKQWGIQGIPTQGVHNVPIVDITPVTSVNDDTACNSYNDNLDADWTWIDDLSWTAGRHFLKFGFSAIRDQLGGQFISSNVYGDYEFPGVFSGFGYSDFLLGLPQTTTISVPTPPTYLRGTTWGIYAQDQFHVNPRLTLNYGLRWELEGPYYHKNSEIYSFDPTNGDLVVPNNGVGHINPFFPSNLPIITASQAGYPAATLVNFPKGNFEPRFAIAYRPFKNGKTVIRGGYGIYGNLIYGTLAENMTGGPFSGSVTYTNAITNGAALFSFPTPTLPSGTVASVANVQGTNPHIKTPYTQQWNLTVERQLGGIGLRISYVGSHSVDLVYERNLDQPPPSTTAFSVSQLAYPLYRSIAYADTGGSEDYNGLELSAKKTYGKDLTFNGGWTWSRDLTDTQDSGGGGGSFAGQTIQNQFDRAAEWANNQVTPTNRIYAYAVYQLPVGRGQRFLSNANRYVDGVFGGWQTSWDAVIQSGEFFTPSFSGFDVSNTNTLGGRPDRIASGSLPSGQQSLNEWFNPAAFKIPGCPNSQPVCPNPADVGSFGNSGLNVLQAHPLETLDFSLMKTFPLRENVHLEFQVNMVNALNHPNFAAPNSNISNVGVVGTIGGTGSILYGEPGPREIDFALRLMF